MKPPRRFRTCPLPLALAAVALCALSGCASHQSFRRAEAAQRAGDWDSAVLYYSKAVDESPQNVEYRMALERARNAACVMHFEKGKKHLEAGNLEEAIVELQQAINLNPAHQYAFTELQRAARMLREKNERERPAEKTLDDMKREAERKQPIGAPPRLSPSSREKIGMQFPEATVEEVLTTLGKIYGIIFLFDDSVRKDQKVSPDFSDVDFQEALELVMLMTNNTYTVVSDKVLMVYPDTQSKRREWEDQVIKTFYLSNADVNDVNQLLRTLIESRRISVNKQLNAISIRDSMDKIAIADQIIRSNDKAKAEVVVDVELIQVDRQKLRQIGIDLATNTFAIQYDLEALPLNNLNRLNDLGAWSVTIPSLVATALLTEGVGESLARPQVRVTEGEKVQIHLGDQVPIPNTTYNTSQTVGGNIVPITSYTYQDVGIKITLEPRVHHNREVTLKMELEFSSVTSTNEAGQPTIGTRQVNTVIRLMDGETNLLAGLIRKDDVKGIEGVPGLTEIPWVKRLFGRSSRQIRETDLLLTLTPHIIRVPDLTEDDLRPLWVGTERNVRLRNKELIPGYGEGPFGGEGEQPLELLRGEKPISDREIMDLMRDRRGTTGVPTVPEEAGGEAVQPPAAEPPSAPAGSGRSSPASGGPPGAPPQPSPAPSPQPVSLGFSPENVLIPVGGTVEIAVVVDTRGNPVSSVPYYVIYDAGVLEVVDVREGDFLRQGGASTMFLHRENTGQVIIGHSRIKTPPDGVKGAGALVTIVFRGKAPGRSALAFTQEHLSGPGGEEYPAQRTSGAVTVTP